jgi:multiple sugar transport system substrate-binding protein
MMKKISLLALTLAILISACAAPATPSPEPVDPATAEPAATTEPSQPTEAPAAEPTAASAEPVTITYALWQSDQVATHEQIIAAFEAQHPNINVEIQLVPWAEYWNKLLTAQAGGEAFDVFWMNGPNFQIYASKGVLMNLQSELDKDGIDMGVFPESLVNVYTYNGDVYGMPKDFDTIALYYNKQLFDAAGVEYPTADWTWDDLKTAASQLTSGDVYGFASLTGDQNGYWNFVYQNGGQMLSPDATKTLIDEQAACDAVKYLYSFVEDGSSPDGTVTAAVEPSTQLFPSGKVAMIAGGSWIAKFLRDSEIGEHVGVAPLPQGKQRASILHGVANVVWSGSDHPAEAVEFVKFLGSQEAEGILASTGTVIPAYNGLQQDWVNAIPDMDLQVFIDALDYAVPYPTTPIGPEWSYKIMTVLGETWTGNVSIDEACSMAAQEANATLAAQ